MARRSSRNRTLAGLQSSRFGANVAGAIADLNESVTGARNPAVQAAARVLRDKIREQLDQRSPEPSAPGESPRRVTGRLRRSVRDGIVNGVQRVGTDDFRAPILEFGARHDDGKVLEPRPFMRPGKQAAEKEMGHAIAKELRGGAGGKVKG